MMKSLWSGVGGLQAHQIAMDVEGNNIANVNTTGFKYSRTNFADLLSQTSKIATAPQDPLGGKNGVQVGLGVSVATVSHIFSQGSIQNTDKNTDMAIQGDGFFIVSPDGGTTFKFTRSGNFTFDAYGNFTDANGFIVQGWTRDDATRRIDNTQPVNNIKIAPGLTTPAAASTQVNLKANLNSGSTQSSSSITPANALDSDSATVAQVSTPDGVYQTGTTILNQQPNDFGVLFNSQGKAFNLQPNQGIWISSTDTTLTSSAVTVTSTATSSIDITINHVNITGTIAGIPTSAGGSAAAMMASNYAALINQYTSQTGVTATVNTSNQIVYTNTNTLDGDYKKNISIDSASSSITGGMGGLGLASGSFAATTAFKYAYTTNAISTNSASSSGTTATNKSFHTTEDLRKQMQWQLQDTSHGGSRGLTVSLDTTGQFVIKNPKDSASGAHNLNLAITSINNTVSSSPAPNSLFTATMNGLAGNLPLQSTASKQSLSVNAATHGSGIDIFDSLGSKHTVSFTFVKVSQDTWQWSATTALPADIGGAAPDKNIFKGGTVTFGKDGSLSNLNPQNLSVSFNNGSLPNQLVRLNFGTSGAFDGLSSYDAASATSLISQDGYTGGDLQDIRIDQNGVLVGSFTNGISYGLAQVALGKFANNEGLMSEGGNIFSMSSNSGNPTIGTASSGGRGSIASSALETSNVDLSRSLTQLIVIQRGYQANSKTITTSDQMLQTLLSLKQ